MVVMRSIILYSRGPFNTNNLLSPQFNTQYHQTQLNQNAASGPLNLPHPIPQNGYSAHSRTMPNSMLPPTAVPHNYIPQWYPPPHTSYQTLQPPPQHQDRRGHSLSGGSESDRICPSNSSHSNDNNDPYVSRANISTTRGLHMHQLRAL